MPGWMLVGWLGCGAEPEVVVETSMGWEATVQSRIAASEYAPRQDGAGFRANNRAQNFRVGFSKEGVVVQGASEVRFELEAWGRDGVLEAAESVGPEEGGCVRSGAVDAMGDCVRQVVFARVGLTEWWENGVSGLEQGFKVEAVPEGEGPLVFDVGLEGAEVEAGGMAARVGSVRYTGLQAWDRTGRILGAWMEEWEGGVRLVVEDEGAILPIMVDPVVTTVHWMAEGDQAGAGFGYSVASAGDVNGDGFGDVIVGAFDYDNGEINEGAAFVYLGSSVGLSTTATLLESNQTGASFGNSVASAGDINGDGYSDVIIGSSYYDNGETNEGAALIYMGSSAGLSTNPAVVLEIDQAEAYFGWSVASAGDVNGDGFGDVVVGAYLYDNGETDEGAAFVYLGSGSGLSPTASSILESNQAYAYMGISVASAGDVNGDGFGDIVMGASLYDNGETDEGVAFVYLGSSTGLSSTASSTLECNQALAYLGHSVASAGDINGDGFGDIIVGAFSYNNGESDEGAAFVYLGSESGLSTTASVILESNQANSYLGKSVASAGDVNGDGFGDLVVGAPDYTNGESEEGAAFVYLGSGSGLATTAGWQVESEQDYAYFGTSVASAGDVNGDGFADVIVGSPYYDNGETEEGAAFVYIGSATGLSTTAITTLESNQENATLGGSVSSAGDVNGDGFGDVIVGAVHYNNGEYEEGAAFVYLGSAAGLSPSANTTLERNQVSLYFSNSVASAGDVNGDGFTDVIVGSPNYDNGENQEGAAFVYLGSAAGLSTIASTTLESDQTDALLGYSVASAGDVDGDGFGDVIVGPTIMTMENMGKVQHLYIWARPTGYQTLIVQL